MILGHWRLERGLREELLCSNPGNRREVFERCYTRLYSELDWLNQFTDSASTEPPEKRFSDWLGVIGEPGDPPAKIFELGPGKGELIGILAARGFDCTASEITSERGGKWQEEQQNLRWVASDGVHLERYVEPESFDTVISSQVIEHLHPDDLDDHLHGVASILRTGGRYILSIPHVYAGPTDISSVFRCDHVHGMHLKEYKYLELSRALEDAGLKWVRAPIRYPGKMRPPRPSSLYLTYQVGIETLIGLLPAGGCRRKVARAARVLYFSPFLMLVAVKD
ncbi:MAG: class I SAM-dependent methyltransferase [Thermoleophilia bacterium]